MREGPFGGSKATTFEQDVQDILREGNPAYEFPKGKKMIDSVDQSKIKHFFEARAAKIDWEAGNEIRVAPPGHIHFKKLPWRMAEANTVAAAIDIDVEKVMQHADALGVDPEEYVLKILFHEQVHLVAGIEDGRQGAIEENQDWNWIGEGIVEREARELYKEYRSDSGENKSKAEHFLKAIEEEEYSGHGEAILALDALATVLHVEAAIEGGTKEVIWNSFLRVHYRNIPLSSDEYERAFESVVAKDSVNALKRAPSGRTLLQILKDDTGFFERLTAADKNLAQKITNRLEKPRITKDGSLIIEL